MGRASVPPFSEFMYYRFDFWFTVSKWTLPLALLIVTLLQVVVGGFVYRIVSGSDGRLGTSLWSVWICVINSAAHGGEKTTKLRFVTLLATAGGLCVFAVFVGIIHKQLQTVIKSLTIGTTKVVEL